LIGLPFLFPLLHVARIALAALVLLQGLRVASRPAVVAARRCWRSPVADAALVTALPAPNIPAAVGYRRPVDPAEIPAGALVAIGDSFVWDPESRSASWVAISEGTAVRS
jgi:hypothetical protein